MQEDAHQYSPTDTSGFYCLARTYSTQNKSIEVMSFSATKALRPPIFEGLDGTRIPRMMLCDLQHQNPGFISPPAPKQLPNFPNLSTPTTSTGSISGSTHELRRNLHNNNIHTYDEVPEATKGDDPILGGGVTLKENNKQQQTAIQGWENYRQLATKKLLALKK